LVLFGGFCQLVAGFGFGNQQVELLIKHHRVKAVGSADTAPATTPAAAAPMIFSMSRRPMPFVSLLSLVFVFSFSVFIWCLLIVVGVI
jgi:hypothetical protein